MNSRNIFQNLLAFGFVAATLLAPLRLGIFEIIRPTLLIMLPCALCLVLMQRNPLGKLLQTPMGLAVVTLCILLTIGHLLENDVIGFSSEEAMTLDVISIWTLSLVFLAALELGDLKYRPGLLAGLGFGLAVHIIGVFLIPPSIHFRDYGRSSGLLHDPNILTIHLVPVLFIWAALLPRGGWQLLAPMALLPVTWATLQTLSRAGLLSLTCAVLVCLAGVLYCVSRSIFRWRNLGFVAAAGVALFVFYNFNQSFLDERMEAHVTRAKEITDKQGSMMEGRLLWWHDMQRLEITDMLKPLGIGYEKFLSSDILPHNTYADTLIIAGPLALLAFVSLFAGAFLKAASAVWRRKNVDISPLRDSGILAAVVSHILILNSLSVLSGKVNWLILGLVYGLLHAQSSVATSEDFETESEQPAQEDVVAVPADS